MTNWPNFTDPQFLDANGVGGLNAAFGSVSGAVATIGSGAWAIPGLLSPEAMTVSFSGMVATVGLPRPWGLIASSGTVVHAHGTQTGQDTTNYTVNFAPLVPASGSLTAYLAATITQIQQTSFPIPGPPQGDPAYNPNFIPTVGYANNLYSIALSAVSGGIDNTSTFELFRTTLTAGQVTASGWSLLGQQRAADRKTWPGVVLNSGGMLTQAQAQTMLSPAVSGLTHTLPSVSTAGGLTYGFTNTTNGAWTISASGADTFTGISSANVNSFVIPPSRTLVLWGDATAGTWDAIGGSPALFGGELMGAPQVFTSNGTYVPTPGMRFCIIEAQGGGGAGGGAGNAVGGSNVSMGAPGTAGTYAMCFTTAAAIGASRAVTVGAGGASGSGAAGGNGGDTVVNSIVTAPGGVGGSTLTNQVAPSVNGNGTFSAAATGANIKSALGSATSQTFALSIGICTTGVGGTSNFGAGGYGVNVNTPGINAVNLGSGGGGTVVNGAGGSIFGGNGAPGCVIIWEYR